MASLPGSLGSVFASAVRPFAVGPRRWLRLRTRTGFLRVIAGLIVTVVMAAGMPTVARAVADPFLEVNGVALDGASLPAPFTADVGADSTVTGEVTWLVDDAYAGKDPASPYQWTIPASISQGVHKLKARWNVDALTTKFVVANFTVVDPNWTPPKTVYEEPAPALRDLWVTADNRRGPVPGVYDWSKAGFGGGSVLPGNANVRSEPACRLTAGVLTGTYGVVPNDGQDDTAGIQAAIDSIKANCSPSGSYTQESLLELPAGTLNISHEIHLDADYLIVRGAGSDPQAGTHLVYKPDGTTRYDTITSDGTRWDVDAMGNGSANGGWLWPGRGLFRVQSRAVAAKYAAEYTAAPANRRDLYEGTVNDHWVSGLKLRGKPGDAGFAGRKGDTVVYLAADAAFDNLKVGGLVNVMAANSLNFYNEMKALPTTFDLQNLHMRQQIFLVTAGDPLGKTITLDKPLEYDVPVTSVSDGSDPINGQVFDSVVDPLVDPVLGVGIENLSFTQDEPTLDAAKAKDNYGNMDPAGAMHGIVFKWAANSWVTGVRSEMTGSHPIATEAAANLSIIDNQFDGAWNKGKGGNGYLRGSRVWDSVYAGNTTRNLRHFTFQWSASGNVAIGNSFDSDLNLHGGYERNNLFELNEVSVPYAHRSANCSTNCGDEGGSLPDDSDWYPIWWAAGQKAVKWSGSSGPNNVFFDNHLRKQLTNGSTPYTDFAPYSDRHRIYRLGIDDAGNFHPLDVGGTPISDWAHNETRDYTGGHGLVASGTDAGRSLFLRTVTLAGYGGPHPQPLRRTWGCSCWDGRGMVNTRLAADPVNTATGSLMETFQDLTLAGVGPGLDWGRTYNSLDATDGPYGVGWTFGFNASIISGDGSAPIFREGTGGQSQFTRHGDGSYTADDPGVTATMTTRSGGGWTVRNHANEELRFDDTGRLVASVDEQGRGVTLAYSGGTLSTLTDTVGQTVTVAWGTSGAATGRIVGVTGSDGHSVGYGYTAAGSTARLTSVVGVDGKTTTYTYDTATGHLGGIVDPTGTTTAGTTYDPATGRVTGQTDAAGGVTTFAWDQASQTATVTDPDGVVHADVYSGNVLASQVDANGRADDVYYDAANQPTEENSTGQQLRHSEYDARGNLVRRTLPGAVDDPSPPEERWTYDAANHVTSYTDPVGKVTSSTYDGQGRLVTTTAPDGGVTTLTYTGRGQVATSTDPLGRTTTNTYNTVGDLVAQAAPSGAVTTYTYDASHHRLSETDPRGTVAGGTPATFTTTYTYDAVGNVLTSTDPLGHQTAYTYDALGRVLTVTAPNAGVSTYTYDGTGNLLTETDPYARVTRHAYDPAGHEVTLTGPDGAITTSVYDLAGQLASRTAPAGNVAGVDAETRRRATTLYTYDAAGRLTQTRTVDPTRPDRYLATTTSYDAAGLPVAVTDPTGAVTHTSHDRAGRVTAVTDPTGAATTTGYDEVGRPKTRTGGGVSVTSTYDRAGQLLRSQTGGGAATTYTYDADGHATTVVDPRGNAAGATPAAFTTTFAYDVAGNRTKVTDPLAHATSTLYDAANQVTKVIDPESRATVYGHDSVGNVNKVTSPTGAVTQYTYDKAGQLKTLTTPTGKAYTYTYDKASRVATATTPTGRVTSYTYTPDGHVNTVTAPAGSATYSYDTLDRQTKIDYSDASPDITWTYDQAGRPSQISNGTSTAAVSYDPAGRTTGITRGPVQVGYTWDGDGRLTGRTLPGGRAQSYTWGADARLTGTGLTVAGTTTTIGYGYDAAGQLTSTSRAGGPVSTRTYDPAGRLTGLTHTAAGGATLLAQTVTLSPAGNPTTVTTQRGSTSTSAVYSYDTAGQVSGICRPTSGSTCTAASPATTYGYDGDGNRTSTVTVHTTDDKSVTSAYDADDRPTADTVGTATIASYSYDGNGNLASSTGPGGTRTLAYGLDTNLRSVVLEDGRTVTYGYDEQGNRTSRTVNGTPDATWTWDTGGPLPVRIGETTGAGTTAHTWWADPQSTLGTAIADGTPGGTLSWLLADTTGSITDIADGAGVTGSASLDPFGGPAAVTGTGYAGNPLRFHGQYLDGVTGLYDLRARDYDASAGRFTGPDAHPAQSGVGFTQAYGYAGNRPTVDADPSGLCPICIGALTGALVGGGSYLVHVARSDDDFSWGGLAKSTATGALYGGLIAAGGEAGFALADGFAGVVAAGAGAGLGSVTAGGLSSHLFGDGGYSWSDAGGDFAIGAGGGLVSAGAGSLAGRAGRTAAGRAVVSRAQAAAAWLARNAPGPRPKDLTAITCAGTGTAEGGAATLAAAPNAGAGADNVVNGVRLGEQLARESASSAFTASGELQSEVIQGSQRIISGSKLQNPEVVKELTSDGSSIADWGKYTSRTFQSPQGPFQVHYYYNPATDVVNYNYDYKIVFNVTR